MRLLVLTSWQLIFCLFFMFLFFFIIIIIISLKTLNLFNCEPHLNVFGVINKHKRKIKTVMQLAYEPVVLTLSVIRSSRKMVFCQTVAIRRSWPQIFYKLATWDSSVSEQLCLLLLQQYKITSLQLYLWFFKFLWEEIFRGLFARKAFDQIVSNWTSLWWCKCFITKKVKLMLLGF